jgi:hypothetical protein
VTLDGTVAAGLLLDSVMIAPPVGAAEDNVTVPCVVLPLVTVVGLIDIPRVKLFGITVSIAFPVIPP